MSKRQALLAISLILLLAIHAAAAQPPAPPAGWTDGYVIANGIRIHYWRTGGDKPPLILAHGSSDDGLCWTNFAKEFVADFDIIMPDARGHGLSDPPSENEPADVQVDDLKGLFDQLHLTKPIVMGHSMGASAAAWFGAKYPGVPRAIVLEDPGLLPRPGGPGGNSDPEARRQQTLERNNRTYDELVAQCVKNSPAWGLSECQFWAPSKLRHHPNTAYRRLGDRPSMNSLFAKITVPTLIIKADAPPDVRKQDEAVAAALAHGTIVHIDGAGHNVRREKKQAMLDALKPFLAKFKSRT
jgi:pimeloyl-ACP methyl ester carboxylesterase